MKLALHRSITFWSGILVMTFIGWAWRDAESHATTLYKSPFQVGTQWGGLGLDRRTKNMPTGPGFRRKSLAGLFYHRREFFPAPFFFRAEDLSESEKAALRQRPWGKNNPYTVEEFQKMRLGYESPGSWSLFIPHWLILLAILLTWTALLLCRARRRKKALEKNPDLAPS